MKSTYEAPVLHRLGGVAELTGTWDDCIFDHANKTLGYPSDTNWNFLPFTDCATGS